MDRLDVRRRRVDVRAAAKAANAVVFVHASPFVSWYGPLVEQLDRVLDARYRRRLRAAPTVARTVPSRSPRTPPSVSG